MGCSSETSAEVQFDAELVRVLLPLVAALRRRGIAAEEAEDLAQEAALAAWRSRHGFDAGLPLLPWLLKIALRKRIDRLRRAGSAPQRGDLGTEDPDPEDAVLLAEERRRLEAALGVLSRREREVIRLFYTEGLKVAAIALQLRMPPGTVKSHLHRARKALAHELREDDEA